MFYICSEAVICDLPHYVGMFIIIVFVSQFALSKYMSLLWGSSELQTFKIFLYLRRWWVLVNEITVKLIFLFMLCTPGREWCEILLFKYYIDLFLYFEGIWCNERVFIYITYWGLPPVTKAITFFSCYIFNAFPYRVIHVVSMSLFMTLFSNYYFPGESKFSLFKL